MTARICLTCRELKEVTICACKRAYFCSDACREKGKKHFELCADLKAKTSTDEDTARLISHWLNTFVQSTTNYLEAVQKDLPIKGSFFDFVGMAEDEIGFLLTSVLGMQRIYLKQMPVCLKEIAEDDPLRSSYVELYRTFLFSPKPRAFLELRILFNNGKLRIFRAELLPPKAK